LRCSREGAPCANIGVAASAATARVMSTFFMKISFDLRWTPNEIGRRLVRIPDGELEAFEVVALLLLRVECVDEAERELEHGQENPHLRACRVPHLRQVPLLAVVVRIAGVRKQDEA